MKIELKSLDLVHFKCFPKLHLDFHEGVNSLFGANAAGKTSVYDALTWLLFDKDSAGHSRPAIKPTVHRRHDARGHRHSGGGRRADQAAQGAPREVGEAARFVHRALRR